MLKDEASPSASLLSSPYDTSAHTKRRGRPSSTGLSCCLRTPACPHSLAKTRPPLQPPFVELALGHVHTYSHTEKDERPMQPHRPLFFDKPLLKVPKLVSRIPPVRASSELAVFCRPKQEPQVRSPGMVTIAQGKCTAVAFHRKVPTLVRARPHRFLRRRASRSPGAVPYPASGP
ncbi:hypothetical protein HPB50_020221 [Hyalomma asiaticum]|uniref:Uncharacterized protein n=1 Tax=Hyalomma asiaticum TaxID=266040 RepID=A0ACB7T865_HYAAI|nr:hypothetical protein HPB50_020221 [Hyalomma asiaticum]